MPRDCELFEELGQLYNAKECRLFIDGNKESLKESFIAQGQIQTVDANRASGQYVIIIV